VDPNGCEEYGSRISAAKKEKEVRMEDKLLSRKKHNEVARVAIAGWRSGCTEKYKSELERQHAASASSIQLLYSFDTIIVCVQYFCF
jgi:hypothetical protein